MQDNIHERRVALYQQAYDLVDKGWFAQAQPILEECLALGSDPSLDVPVRQELARVRRELGDLQGALDLRYEVKRLAPDRHANLCMLAQLLDELGRIEEAAEEARAAVRLVPNNRKYLDTLTLLERKSRAISPHAPLPESAKRKSRGVASDQLQDFRVYANTQFLFEVSIPYNWQVEIRNEGEIRGGLVSRLLSRLSTFSGGTDVLTATAPQDEGFARAGILVRAFDRYAEKRGKMQFAAESQVSVAGIPAIQVEYVLRGTRFRKIAVQYQGQEYVLQFAHDGTFDVTIDRIVRSFRFL